MEGFVHEGGGGAVVAAGVVGVWLWEPVVLMLHDPWTEMLRLLFLQGEPPWAR